MKITLLTGKTFDIKEALGFDIVINTSGIAKKLSLRIDHKRRLPVLTIPKYCSQKKAIEFARQNRDWIERQMTRLPMSKSFEDGDIFSFFGQPLTIKHSPSARSGVYIENNLLITSGDPEFLSRRVKDFLKKEAKKEFLIRSKAKAALIDCKINSVVIKDTVSRWGSCSTNNNINYNWRIAFAPEEVIEYLICHEVSHLAHQDHSRDFWMCVKKLNPTYLRGKNWLKINSKQLYTFE